MASNLSIPSCIENESGDDGIMCATFDCEARLPLSDTYEAISDSLGSKNLNLSLEGLLTSPLENNVENNVDNKTHGLKYSLNKTFDARRKKSVLDEPRGVVLDKTINLLSMKPINLSLHLDSEESLGIISEVLDDNTTLDLLEPFKSREKSSLQFIKRTIDANLITFSPLHLRNSNGVYLEDNGSPMICRFTSTPEPTSSKQQLSSEMKQDYPTEEGVAMPDFIESEKCHEDFGKGSIFSATSKVSQLKSCINVIEDCLNKIETTHILPKDLLSETNIVQLGKNQMKQDNPTEEGVAELDCIEEKCYEDFKKGNIFASTSKVSQLKNCLNKIEAIPLLPNDLHPKSDNVQLGGNITLEINSADQSSLFLNATFDVKPEPLKEDLPISELQTDSVPVSLKDIPKNETFTFDSINNAAEEKNKINTTFIDLPEKKESNISNLGEALGSCLSISDINKNKQKEHDSCTIKSTNKSNFVAKRPMFKRSIAIPTQKLNPSKMESNMNSEFNSTFCMGSNEPSNNNPTNLDKRCSLESSLGIPRHSNIGLLKTHSQLKSNRISNAKCMGYQPSGIKAASSSTRSARRISLGKSAVSPIKQKNLINFSLSKTTVKPRVNSQIKNPNSEVKVSLDNTFTKDDKINFALSPIIEKENKFTESMEEVLDLPYVEKNRTLSQSKVDVENKKIPKHTHNVNPRACTPIENENEKNSTSNQCVENPAFLTKRFQKVDSTNIPLTKPKQSSNDKLVSKKKTNYSIIPKSQNIINLNGKCNLLQTLKDPQFSRLPTLASTFSKGVLPIRPKVNRMMPIDSLRVLPNQCSSTSNSKPVQSVRMLRAPGNKLKPPSVFGKTVSSCLEKGS